MLKETSKGFPVSRRKTSTSPVLKTPNGVARYSRIVKLSEFPPVRGRHGRLFQTAWLECGHLHESDGAERRRGTVYCPGCYDGRAPDFDPQFSSKE